MSSASPVMLPVAITVAVTWKVTVVPAGKRPDRPDVADRIVGAAGVIRDVLEAGRQEEPGGDAGSVIRPVVRRRDRELDRAAEIDVADKRRTRGPRSGRRPWS